MKTIKTFTSLLGGYAYRITSNGNVVNYEERKPQSARFCVVASESVEAFEQFAAKTKLFDSYCGDNPALVARRIDELKGNFYC